MKGATWQLGLLGLVGAYLCTRASGGDVIEEEDLAPDVWLAKIPIGVASVAYELPILALCILCCARGEMPWIFFRLALNFQDLRESPPQLKVAWMSSMMVFVMSPIIMVIATSQLWHAEHLGDFKCEAKVAQIEKNLHGCVLTENLHMPADDESTHILEAVDVGWPILAFASIGVMMGFGGMLLTKMTHTKYYVWWVCMTLFIAAGLVVIAVFVHIEVDDLISFCRDHVMFSAAHESNKACEETYTDALKDILRHCAGQSAQLDRKFHWVAEVDWFTHGDLYCQPEEHDFHGCNCHCKETTEITCSSMTREASLLNVFVWFTAIVMMIGSIAAAASPRGTLQQGQVKVRQPLSRKATRSRLERSNSRGSRLGLERGNSRAVAMT